MSSLSFSITKDDITLARMINQAKRHGDHAPIHHIRCIQFERRKLSAVPAPSPSLEPTL